MDQRESSIQVHTSTDSDISASNKVSFSLVWHLVEQKGERNAYMSSTYESHLLCVSFI